MEIIKKYLDYILLGIASLFSFLEFVIMFGSGIFAKSGSFKMSYSIYECFEINAMPVFAMVFMILVLLSSIGLIALAYFNKNIGFEVLIALFNALLAFLAFIFYLCTLPTEYKNFGYRIGAGSIFASIFALICAGSLAFFGVKKILKK